MAWVCVCSFGCVDIWPCSLSGLGAGCPVGMGARLPPGGALCGRCAGPGLAPRVPGAGSGGGAAFDRVHWPSSAPGFRGLGLGLCFAVVSARRCLRGAFLAVAGPWFRGFPVLGSVGERGLHLCVYAFEIMLIFCVLAGWRVVEADSIIPPSLFSQAAPLGTAAPFSLLSLPLSPVTGASTSRWLARPVCHPCMGPPPRTRSGSRLCLAGWARVLCGK